MADIKLFNKGKRTIFGEHKGVIDEKTGQKAKFAFGPQTTQAFDEEMANKLRKLYPNEIVSLDDVRRQFDSPATAATPATHVTIDQAKDMIAAAVSEAIEKERNRLAAEIASAGVAQPRQAVPHDPIEVLETAEPEKTGLAGLMAKLTGA